MIVFLDTEFTDLIHPELLSIGLVTIDGREFYAELDPDTVVGQERIKRSSDFVRFEGVIDMWWRIRGATCTVTEIGLRLGRWLQDLAAAEPDAHSQQLLIAFDYSTDYELMEESLRDVGLWEGLRSQLSPFNVFPVTGSQAGLQAAEAYYAECRGEGIGRHHALADARALRASYLAAKVAHGRQGTAT